jgi:hypothetical protein
LVRFASFHATKSNRYHVLVELARQSFK